MKRSKKLVLLVSLLVLFTLLVLVPEKQESEVETYSGLSKQDPNGHMRCFCPNKSNSCGCVYHTDL